MLHTKFQGDWPLNSGEDFWAWQSYWSCDQHNLNKIYSLIKYAFGFEAAIV